MFSVDSACGRATHDAVELIADCRPAWTMAEDDESLRRAAAHLARNDGVRRLRRRVADCGDPPGRARIFASESSLSVACYGPGRDTLDEAHLDHCRRDPRRVFNCGLSRGPPGRCDCLGPTRIASADTFPRVRQHIAQGGHRAAFPHLAWIWHSAKHALRGGVRVISGCQ